jgi:hypothetical protein
VARSHRIVTAGLVKPGDDVLGWFDVIDPCSSGRIASLVSFHRCSAHNISGNGGRGARIMQGAHPIDPRIDPGKA